MMIINNNNNNNNKNNNNKNWKKIVINFIVPYKNIIQFHSLKSSKHSLSQDFS